MSNFFVAYSGRNSKKVAAIVSHLSKELGGDQFWFAATRSFTGVSIRESLLSAIQEARAVLIFESAATYRFVNLDEGKQIGLSRRQQLLIYERDEVARLGKQTVNIAIGAPQKVGLNEEDFGTFNLSMRLDSDKAKRNLMKLTSHLREMY